MGFTDSQNLGVIVIIMSIILFLVVLSFSLEIQESTMETCSCLEMGEGVCPMETEFPTQGYVGIVGAVISSIIGIIIIIKGRGIKKTALEKSKRIKNILKTLKGEEKKMYDLIEDSEGVILQSDLIEKTKYSKVKLSRILDKLEAKGIVERKRRGMSNIVMLKTR